MDSGVDGKATMRMRLRRETSNEAAGDELGPENPLWRHKIEVSLIDRLSWSSCRAQSTGTAAILLVTLMRWRIGETFFPT
jgi:hypothetical protein